MKPSQFAMLIAVIWIASVPNNPLMKIVMGMFFAFYSLHLALGEN